MKFWKQAKEIERLEDENRQIRLINYHLTKMCSWYDEKRKSHDAIVQGLTWRIAELEKLHEEVEERLADCES